jgi:colanic acid/amylovoran biosynthesis glycosyltransferase
MSEQSSKPEVWIVARVFGASGQPWLWRQATKMTRLRPHVVCWSRRNEQTYPVGDVPVTVLRHHPAPYEASSRWIHRVCNASSGNFFASRGAEFRDLCQTFERTRPSAVVCHFGDIAMRLLPLARRYGIPLVAHFHGIQQNLHDRWFYWSLMRALRDFAAIVVVGTAERDWLLTRGVDPERVHAIPCGAPANVFTPCEDRPAGPIRFALASRLVEEKGVEISVKAFALVAPRIKGSELHLFGDGPLRERLEGVVAANGLRGRVVFHGYVDENGLIEHLPNIDVFLQHSLTMPNGWQEGFGVSVTEASACGLPVVVSACGGLLDQVVDGHNGLVVPQRDVRAMADAMCALAADPGLRDQMGKNGRERVLQHFDSGRQIRRLEDVVVSTLARHDIADGTFARRTTYPYRLVAR